MVLGQSGQYRSDCRPCVDYGAVDLQHDPQQKAGKKLLWG